MVVERFLKPEYYNMLLIEESPDILLNGFTKYMPPQEKWVSLMEANALVSSQRSAMIDVLSWICIRNKRVLCTRTLGKKVFYLPGGKREDDESDWDALSREIQEELNVILVSETLAEFGVVEGPAHGYPEFTQVRMKCFRADYTGQLVPNAEIEEIAWFQYSDQHKCAPAAQKVIDSLFEQKLIG